MAAVTICSDFGAPQNTVSHCFHYFPISIPHDVMGPDAMILVFWVLSFKPTFSLSSFTFIKRLFSSSSLSAIKLVSSAYLRLLVFLPAILIPACASSSLTFHMMYTAYKLNTQGDNIQPWCTAFLIWNQCVFPCPILTVASWPACRFLRKQVRCLVFLSLEEFSTVCCEPHSQRLWLSNNNNDDDNHYQWWWWHISIWWYINISLQIVTNVPSNPSC